MNIDDIKQKMITLAGKGCEKFINNIDDNFYEFRKRHTFSFWKNKEESLSAINELLDNKEKLNLNENTVKYLESKKKLSFLIGIYSKLQNEIITYIKQHHENRKIKDGLETSLFKELLVYVDYIFAMDSNKYCKNNPNKKDRNKDNIYEYVKEEICEAASYLIYLYNEEIGIKQNIAYHIDADYILSHDIDYIVLKACKFIYLKEYESCIDYYDYNLQMKDNNIIIDGDKNDLEKSIIAGYIKRLLREQRNYDEEFNNIKYEKISEIIKKEIVKTSLSICETKNYGKSKRYVLKTNAGVLYGFKLYSDQNCFFEEECKYIRHCERELIEHKFLDVKITNSINIKDILLFQRLFLFLYHLSLETIFKKTLYSKENVLNSLVPSFKKDDLVNYISILVGDAKKAEELLEFFSCDFSKKTDLQYTPFIKNGDYIYFSNTLVARSNLLCNSIILSRKKENNTTNNNGVNDQFIELCRNIFSYCSNFNIKSHIKNIKYNGEETDIDFVAISDENVFIFECKNVMASNNNEELRKDFDVINKANSQLDLIRKAFSDENWKNSNLSKDDINLLKNKKMYFCILLGNRNFCGYKNKYPIRYIYELDNVITNGYATIDDKLFKIWKGEKFAEIDLINFLSENNNFHIKFIFNNLRKIEEKISIYEYNFIKETYCLIM